MRLCEMNDELSRIQEKHWKTSLFTMYNYFIQVCGVVKVFYSER